MLLTGSICRFCLRKLTAGLTPIVIKRPIQLNPLNNHRKQVNRQLSTTFRRLRLPTEVSDSEELLYTRYLYVHTSLQRWDDVPDGILLDVGYGDSNPDKPWDGASPTVLALHSSPGSHESLTPILRTFVKSGCRVIAPNFPGFGFTEGISTAYTDVFNHSVDEKAEFVRDFLGAFGIERVDLVIGHGSGCYPLLRLATTTETAEMFKSAMLISPWPHKEFKHVQPIILHKTITFLWDRPFLRFLCRLSSAIARSRLGLKGSPTSEVITTSRNIAGLNFLEISGGLVAADMLSLPLVTCWAEDDPWISPTLYRELCGLLGIGDNHVTVVGEDGKIKESGSVKSYPKSVLFEKGGKDIHIKHAGLINAISLDLLKHVSDS